MASILSQAEIDSLLDYIDGTPFTLPLIVIYNSQPNDYKYMVIDSDFVNNSDYKVTIEYMLHNGETYELGLLIEYLIGFHVDDVKPLNTLKSYYTDLVDRINHFKEMNNTVEEFLNTINYPFKSLKKDHNNIPSDIILEHLKSINLSKDAISNFLAYENIQEGIVFLKNAKKAPITIFANIEKMSEIEFKEYWDADDSNTPITSLLYNMMVIYHKLVIGHIKNIEIYKLFSDIMNEYPEVFL